ncbi:hypothetical protein A6M23_06380 [Acidithiobacillus thiooxidans]|uniref:Glycosyltransferase 2-like domain-containing protein n=2 Tax=Acidithiobacillus thiooxidans TaxID=930 RepID=A0A1C2IE13_ACITH|nr:hypothetical protein A6M23_06380 [Acidithiobacillus thiooxidans]OCX87053.1 hypothetical protein A6P08_04355 [Acidithiobacillus thiooxidans]
MTFPGAEKNPDHSPQSVVLILGMHRSGSSLLGSVCASLGVNMGAKLIPPDQHNPAGYWEDAELVDIQENLLESMQQPWHGQHGADPYPSGWWREPSIAPYREAMDQILANVATSCERRGFKDPRSSRFLPLWRELMPHHRLEPCFILALRDPREVAVSLMRRNGMTLRHALRIWIRYNLDAIRDSEGLIRGVFDYARWFSAGEEQLTELAEALSITPPDKTEQTRILNLRIRSDLRRSTTNIELPVWADAIYDALLKLTRRKLQKTDFAAVLTMLEYWDTLLRHGAEEHGQLDKLPVVISTLPSSNPVQNRHIPVADDQLARLLCKEGHPVTLLILAPYQEETHTDFRHLQKFYATAGIGLQNLPALDETQINPWHIARSWLVYHFLSRRQFPLVYITHQGGCAFYSLLAQCQGLAFVETLFCLLVTRPTDWACEANQCFPNAEAMECIHMETQSLAMAKQAVISSQYMLNWLRHKATDLPPQLETIPALTGIAHPTGATTESNAGFQEIVFCGQLDAQHGLDLFLTAMNTLVGKIPDQLIVTFLGSNGLVDEQTGFSMIDQQTQAWPWVVQVLGQYDDHLALDYLQHQSCLTIMPARTANSDFMTQACILLGIPCVFTDVGDMPEHISTEDHIRLIAPNSAAIAASLLEFIQKSPRQTNALQPAYTEAHNAQSWLNLHNALLSSQRVAHELKEPAYPLVSVCLTHYRRPQLLAQAIASLETMDYPNLEVLLVDDGSDDAASRSFLDKLDALFTRRGWKIIRQENKYLGAARNVAAQMAQGSWLLFMDDDNFAKPAEIQLLVEAAQRTGARIVTTAMHIFRSDDPPVLWEKPQQTWVPLAGPCMLGIQRNLFGDANALVHRDTFVSLGGFTEDRAGHEDWEFFSRASLAGIKLVAVPEPLFWYRNNNSGMLANSNSYRDHQRSLRPYLTIQPAILRNLPVLAHGQSAWRRSLVDSRTNQAFSSEIFWSKNGVFSQEHATHDVFTLDYRCKVHLSLPKGLPQNYAYLRWDPMDRAATFQLETCLLRVDGVALWYWDKQKPNSSNEICMEITEQQAHQIYATGNDPWLVFSIPESIAQRLAISGGVFEVEFSTTTLDWKQQEAMAMSQRQQQEAMTLAQRQQQEATLSAQLDDLRQQLQNQNTEIAHLQIQLAQLLTSRSWRLTAPLRSISAKIPDALK